MSVTLALLDHTHDAERVRLDSGFRLSDEMLIRIDKLVAAGKGRSRAEVIKHILNYALQGQEDIGRCELCGVVDHHLYDGACSHCRKRYRLPEPGEGWLRDVSI